MKTNETTLIGQMIREIRESQSLTVEKFAALAGIYKSDVSDIETGQRNFTINTLAKVASALNCTIDVRLIPK